ncbi:MAG: CsbD family protein [Pyrinomonadaceae bacterium MAG19_C2-C3]|nr:CsbD family protein [Pyrinomonadaceae bacterium MAG19_C2-C3]
MSLPNDDEVKGTWDKAKGAVKENVGHAVGDEQLEAEGQADRASGNVQDAYGEAKRKTGDAINDVGDAIKR